MDGLFKQVQCASLLRLLLHEVFLDPKKNLGRCVNAGTANICWHWLAQRKMQEAPLSQIGVVYLILYERN